MVLREAAPIVGQNDPSEDVRTDALRGLGLLTPVADLVGAKPKSFFAAEMDDTNRCEMLGFRDLIVPQ
jgi:hypothetical protein